jgi:hypothetical protein
MHSTPHTVALAAHARSAACMCMHTSHTKSYTHMSHTSHFLSTTKAGHTVTLYEHFLSLAVFMSLYLSSTQLLSLASTRVLASA